MGDLYGHFCREHILREHMPFGALCSIELGNKHSGQSGLMWKAYSESECITLSNPIITICEPCCYLSIGTFSFLNSVWGERSANITDLGGTVRMLIEPSTQTLPSWNLTKQGELSGSYLVPPPTWLQLTFYLPCVSSQSFGTTPWRAKEDLHYRTDALTPACCILMSPPLSSRERSGNPRMWCIPNRIF